MPEAAEGLPSIPTTADRLGRTSVIIPAYRAWSTLPLVLDALAPQIHGSREAIVVDSSGDGTAAGVGGRWPWVRFVALDQRVLPGRARNIGAGLAGGDRLAFLDADTVPAPRWLDELEQAMVPSVDAAAGAIRNGTPHSLTGTAGYLLEFSDWLPGRRGPLEHAASASLLVRRCDYDARGGMPEDVWPGEDTIFTFPLGCRGALAFAPRAIVDHLNRTSFLELLRHQYRLGASHAQVCEQVAFPHGWVSRPPGSLLAVPLRLAALGRRLACHPPEARQAVRVFPLLALGLVAWTLGLYHAHGLRLPGAHGGRPERSAIPGPGGI